MTYILRKDLKCLIFYCFYKLIGGELDFHLQNLLVCDHCVSITQFI